MKLKEPAWLLASTGALLVACAPTAPAAPIPLSKPADSPAYQPGQALPGGYYAFASPSGPWNMNTVYFCDTPALDSCAGHAESNYYDSAGTTAWRAATLTYSATSGWSAVESGNWYYFY